MALAYFRSPLRYPGVSDHDKPLPGNLEQILEALGRPEGDGEFGAAAALGVSAGELREAALFYVKQLLFGQEGDHYRTLGLRGTASTNQIKKHYRLLIRIFHPDRMQGDGDWNERYAIRINEAYNTLKSIDRRQAYDRSRLRHADSKPAASPLRRRKPPPVNRRPDASQSAYQPSLSEYMFRSRLWSQRPAVLVWGGIVALALILVGVGYLMSAPPELVMTAVMEPAGKTGVVQEQVSMERGSRAPEAGAELPDYDTVSHGVPYWNREPVRLGGAGIDGSGTETRPPSTGTDGAVTSPPGLLVNPAAGDGTAPVPEGGAVTSLPEATAWDANLAVPAKISSAALQPEQARAEVPVGKTGHGARETPAPAVTTHDPGAPSNESPGLHSQKDSVSPGPSPGLHDPVQAPPEARPVTTLDRDIPHAPSSGTPPKKASGSSRYKKPVRTAALPTAAGRTTVNRGITVTRRRLEPKPRLAMNQAAAPPVAPAEQPNISHMELMFMIGRLISAYESGNLKTFIRLFSDDARINTSHGRRKIKKEYATVFRNTRDRRMAFRKLHWQNEGEDRMKGQAGIAISMYSRKDTTPRNYEGQAALGVEKQKGILYITEFIYTLDGD